MPPSVITFTRMPRATVKLFVAVTSGLVYGISKTVVSIFVTFPIFINYFTLDKFMHRSMLITGDAKISEALIRFTSLLVFRVSVG
jgi:hypothetical protein